MAEPFSSLDLVAGTVRLGLTPAFLLIGIGGLLNVFTARVGRVADRMHALTDPPKGQSASSQPANRAAELTQYRRRLYALDAAVVLAGMGGMATCGSVLTLFIGAVRNSPPTWLLFGLFGLGVGLSIAAVLAFTIEMLIASQGTHARLQSLFRHFHHR